MTSHRVDGRFVKILFRTVLIGLIPVWGALPVAAATYYADPGATCPCTAPNLNTDPNCGQQSNPYSCIADGVVKAVAGDIVEAAPGTYDECVYIHEKQDITVRSQVSRGATIQRNHEHPVCDQIDPDSGGQIAVVISSSSGVMFEGFKVTGSSGPGIGVWGTGLDNEINDVESYGNGTGMLFYMGGNIVSSSSAHDNAGSGIVIAGGAADMRLFYVDTSSNGGSGLDLHAGSDRTNIGGFTANDNVGFGVYLASNDNSLIDVTINDNGAEGLYVQGSGNAVSSGQILRNSRGILVTCFVWPCTTTPLNNAFYTLDVGYSTKYDGIDIDGGMGTLIWDSRIHHGPSNGILESRYASYSLILYNEVDNNGAKAVPWLGHGLYLGGRSSTIRGNKVHDNGGWGVHLWAAPWGTPQNHYIVEHNEVYRNPGGVVLGGSNVYPADPLELPQYTEIRYNMIHHNESLGFWYLLTTCTGVNNTGNSFHHNTVVDNDDVGVWLTHAYDDQLLFKNNIVVARQDKKLLATTNTNMQVNGVDGNLYFRPESNPNSPLFEWNGSGLFSLAELQSPGVPQADPNVCPLVDPDPNARIPHDVHSTFDGGFAFLDPTMNRWVPDPFGTPYNANFHLMPGSQSVEPGVCCPETTGGTDIDGEGPGFCAPADCASSGTGVGADYFLDSDSDGMANRYDCLPTQAWNAEACDGDLWGQSQESACGPSGRFDFVVHPNAFEICDGKDDDCNGQTLPGGEIDADTDGYFFDDMACSPDFLDCNDADPKVHPDAQELCDLKDNDCDEETDELGTYTCGVGICERTTDVCVNGALQACTPGTPSAEGLSWAGTCFDGLDNDCDGRVDNDCAEPSQSDLIVSGSISSGIMQDLDAGSYDDTYQKFDEALVGSDYRLTVVWTFVNPSGGLLHDLVVEGYRAFGNDSFQFAKAERSDAPCTATEAWAPILTLSKPVDDDIPMIASTDVTGPVTCIRVIDTVTNDPAVQDRLALDRLFLFPTPVAVGETGPNPGTLVSGTYSTTKTSNDVREIFLENTSGNPNDLVHTWIFRNVPAGSSHQLNLEGNRTGSDNFKFYFSTDNQTYTPIPNAEIKYPFEQQGGGYYPFGDGSISGTVYIRMKDNNNNPSNSSAATVRVDRLAIKTIP